MSHSSLEESCYEVLSGRQIASILLSSRSSPHQVSGVGGERSGMPGGDHELMT